MTTTQQTERLGRLAAEFQVHCPELRSQHIADSLLVGLTHLRDLLMVRAHDDVEQEYGEDSMFVTSFSNKQRQTRNAEIEIDAYSCIVVDDEVTERGYVNNAELWFLDWIFHLRLGEECRSIFDKRVGYYSSRTIDVRRLKFVSMLQHVIPQSARAPLILFRLFPRSVRVSAAVAFGDALRAQELRAEQIRLLPAINDCHECHGRVLDNEEICRCCGNPVWNFVWLLSD